MSSWLIVLLAGALWGFLKFFADGGAGRNLGMAVLNGMAILCILIGSQFGSPVSIVFYFAAGFLVLLSIGLLIHRFSE